MLPLPTPSEAIREIVDWTLHVYSDGKGGLPRSVDESGRTSKERLFHDLGDYLPFFAYLGEREFCLRQLEDTRHILTPEGLLPPAFRYFGLPCTRSYEHTDLLLGLIDAYTFFPSQELRDDIERVAKGVIRTFHPEGKWASSWYFPSMQYRFPVFDFKDGMFIEIWTLISQLFKNPLYEASAERLGQIVRKYTPTTFAPLIPRVVGTNIVGNLFVHAYFSKETNTYTPMKYLSNTAYAFLEKYRSTKQAADLDILERIRIAIEQHLLSENGAVCERILRDGRLQPLDDPALVQNFPLADWAADCAYYLKDGRFLELAERIMKPWLDIQDTSTGLLPQNLYGTATDLDSLTDTSTALFKIAELTNDSRYRQAAERIIEGILRFHRQPDLYGYVLSVDFRTGTILDPVIKIKFVCLFLKALIVLDQHKSIFGTELYELTKDR